MRNGFLGAIAALMAGAGLVGGQEPPAIGMPPGMGGVTGYPAPLNPEGLATNDVQTPNFWFGAEYLGVYMKRSLYNYPLVTTSSRLHGGIIGASTTSILYQGPDNNELFSGGRINGGMFFAGDNRFGFELGGFILGDGKERFSVASSGSGTPLLARPYVDLSTGNSAATVIASTGVGPGDISVNSKTDAWGANAHWLLNLYRSSPMSPWGFNLNVLAGMSVFSLRDSLDVVSTTTYFDNVRVAFNNQTFLAGDTFVSFTVDRLLEFDIFGQLTRFLQDEITLSSDTTLSSGIVDRYRVSNQFYGGEIGFGSQVRAGRLSIGLTGKLGLGVTHTSVEIQGYSTLTSSTRQFEQIRRIDVLAQTEQSRTVEEGTNTIQQTVPGGVYATNGRIGRYSQNTFAVMPEGVLTLNYQISRTLSASLGYSFLYLNKVVRTPDVVSQQQSVDPVLIPTNSAYSTRATTTQPAINLFPYTSYWIQGLNAGISIQY